MTNRLTSERKKLNSEFTLAAGSTECEMREKLDIIIENIKKQGGTILKIRSGVLSPEKENMEDITYYISRIDYRLGVSEKT